MLGFVVNRLFFFKLDKIHCNASLDSDPIDIDKYLPIKSSDEAEAFCSNEDGLLDQRKKALCRRVYAATDISGMAASVASITDIFFHENYQISHRWPSKK